MIIKDKKEVTQFEFDMSFRDYMDQIDEFLRHNASDIDMQIKFEQQFTSPHAIHFYENNIVKVKEYDHKNLKAFLVIFC